MSGPNRSDLSSRCERDRRPPTSTAAGRRNATGRWRERGQTTLDFAIGISVFLSVMLFIFAFVPGILQPFSLSGESDTVLSERLASDLSQSVLGDPSTPYVLESNCAVQFFEEGDSPPGHCNYDGSVISERLNVGAGHNVNVSLQGTLSGPDGDLVCWDVDSQDLVETNAGTCGDDGGDDVVLAAGPIPPEANDATVTARRVVSLHQENLTMKVVVW